MNLELRRAIPTEKLNQITKIRIIFKFSCENSEMRKRTMSYEKSVLTRRKLLYMNLELRRAILTEKLNQITKIRVVFKFSCENSEMRKRKASSETSDLRRRKF